MLEKKKNGLLSTMIKNKVKEIFELYVLACNVAFALCFFASQKLNC